MDCVEERFQAAVNVIKGLPKNGPYQPSTGMMLKFYGFYKQAMEGPCHQKKPPFWDIVGRAKWDAWNDNRNMTKQQAMQSYVDNLRDIIETMSFTENVQNFVGSLNELDISLNDLDTVAPGMREIAETHPDSPFASRTANTHNRLKTNELPVELEATNVTMLNGHSTVNANKALDENSNAEYAVKTAPSIHERLNSSIIEQSDDEYGDPYDFQVDLQQSMTQQNITLQHINYTVKLMNNDLVALNRRVDEMERMLREMRQQIKLLLQLNNSAAIKRKLHNFKWWPFTNISPMWFAILLLWPFTIKLLKQMRHTSKH